VSILANRKGSQKQLCCFQHKGSAVYQSGDGTSVHDIQLNAAAASEVDLNLAPSIVFPKKDLLFTADFKRLGTDLLLFGDSNQTAIIYDYFKGDRRATITTLEGASLTGAAVEALAGPDHPGEYAQAQATPASQRPIGRVEKAAGSATVVRNGISIELHLGDPVFKGDVVQTGSDSSLTIKFNDGTVFGLSASARIILSEMVYAADSAANSALFTLIQGTIGFIAGKIAKTGDLNVETPVATMAIRGTAVKTEISAVDGTTKFSLLTEPDGTTGSFLLIDKHNPSRVITSISDPGVATIVASAAVTDVRMTQVLKTTEEVRTENAFVREMFQTFSFEPRQRRGSGDSIEILPIPVLDFLPAPVGPDQPRLAVVPGLLNPLAFNVLIPILDQPSQVAIQGAAFEDGPFIKLDAIGAASARTSNTGPVVVNVPASLPPGVNYLESSRAFTLDPSHPAYQSLGEGETTTVTVNYSLSGAGAQTPTTAVWTITGRNDAPVARADAFANVNESRVSALAVRANDSDIDGDALHITGWTAPIEGSVSLNRSGELNFDPGSDFQALSAGETATVSFTYTIADENGETDIATTTVHIRGAGTFSSLHTTAATSGTLAFNNQSVSLQVDAPSRITTKTADLGIKVDFGPVLQPQMNIVYAVDISGSTSGAFAGTAVGDVNQDGTPNSVLDAEIESLIGLTERIRSLGFSSTDVTVTVVPFNGSANPADNASASQDESDTASVTFNLGGSGDETVANFLRSLHSGGGTNFEGALQAVIEKLQAVDQGGEENVVYFLSDGNGTGSFQDELATLNSVHHAKITAIGIGEDANLSLLEQIDNTGGAEMVASTNELETSLVGFPLPTGDVIDVDVFINGEEILEIGYEDLVRTSAGLTLQVPLAGLDNRVGDRNTVLASVTFTGGLTLTTELGIAGALPVSADFML
jgi:VCBS repeat-containing protein